MPGGQALVQTVALTATRPHRTRCCVLPGRWVPGGPVPSGRQQAGCLQQRCPAQKGNLPRPSALGAQRLRELHPSHLQAFCPKR